MIDKSIVNLVRCSSAHLCEEDEKLFSQFTREDGAEQWVFDTTYGYLVHIGYFTHPLLELKRRGFSRDARVFFYHMIKKHNAYYIHFDCDDPPVKGEKVFDW